MYDLFSVYDIILTLTAEVRLIVEPSAWSLTVLGAKTKWHVTLL